MYTAWIDYGATGEGQTIMIAIAYKKEAAINCPKNRTDDYYHIGIQVKKGIPEDIKMYIPEFIQKYVTDKKAPMCYFQWYGECHINCS